MPEGRWRGAVWRGAGFGLILLLVVLTGWWALAPSRLVDASPRATSADPPTRDPMWVVQTTPPTESVQRVEILLRTVDTVRARGDGIRLGQMAVAPEDLSADLIAAEPGAAVSAGAAELAQVQTWRSLDATAVTDGWRIGPIELPASTRFRLTAPSSDPRYWYIAEFTADTAPQVLEPLAAAGLRLRRSPEARGSIDLSLRRQGESEAAATWQQILRERAPALLTYFDDQAVSVQGSLIELAPLPPGPLEALIRVGSVEILRQSITLDAGRWTELPVDPVAEAVGAEFTVDLALEFRERDDATPIGDLTLAFEDARGRRTLRTDAAGRVLLAGLDRRVPLQLQLSFPTRDVDLPDWPEWLALDLPVDRIAARSPDARTLRERIELDRLDWLLIRSRSIRFTDTRERGQPWPVFALQRQVDGQWRDHSSDYFRPHTRGLAVSLSEPGRYRLVAALSPWSLHFSREADTSLPRRDGRHEVEIEAGRGRTAEVRVSTLGRNLAGAPVHLVSPLPGMPPAVVTADAEGRIRLDDVTVDVIALEVPGYAQVEVRLDATQQQVQLTPDDAER